MAVAKHGCGKAVEEIILFDLAQEGIDPVNYQRVALNVRSLSGVRDAYVERGHRPNVEQGILRAFPDLSRVPAQKHGAALAALDERIDAIIQHRVKYPERHAAGKQLIPIS